jgi:ribosomal protein S6
MATCQETFAFLTGVANRNVTTTLPDADLAALQQLSLIQRLSADQYAQLSQEVQTLQSARTTIDQETAGRSQLAYSVQTEERKAHSILFHFESRDKQTAQLQKEAQDEAALRATDTDLTQRIQGFNELVAKQSLLDTLSSYSGGYVALTGAGVLQLRQLGIRLYRVSDQPFAAYWAESQQTDRDLTDLATRGTQYVAGLSTALPPVTDRAYLWAIALGLAKLEPDPTRGGPLFLDAYNQLADLAHNPENRLMSAEMLATLRRSVAENLPLLRDLDHEVRKAGVPKESSLGVASMLLLGQREDGTFATANLSSFLGLTKSYESAALLAIVNRPFTELAQKFGYLRQMFASWGYEPSEDVELSSAYLTLSELPLDGMNTKLAIIAKGMGAYLQYPLVASSILAAIPVLEANETLNLLEEAYEIVGRRAMPMAQPELICLAVRMVHGVRTETVQGLDATGKAVPTVPTAGYYYGPRFFFVPILVAHGAYYSTYSGLGGAHPGHAHMGAGGFTG